ncbi:MAG: FtsX-like permease family protein, partial [Trebonia sp.]
LGVAGAAPHHDGGGIPELAGGLVALTIAIVLLAPVLLGVIAAAGRLSPISVRLALRDLARYRARSGPALAAISLATLITVIICVASAASFGGALGYTGPNLTSSQLIVWTPSGPYGGETTGPKGAGPGNCPNCQTNAPPVSEAEAQKVANEITAGLGPATTVILESTSAGLEHGSGASFSGPIFVATPQLLNAFGIKQSQISPGADILSMRPGLSTTSMMQLAYGSYAVGPGQWPCPPGGTCVDNPVIQEVSQLPSGTSAPNTVITEHAVAALRLRSSITTSGWLIAVPNGLTAAQIVRARQLAAGASGMSVETRGSIPSLTQVLDTATAFGIVLALGILSMSVGLVRSEAARDLRTLTATGAAPRTRRTITAATAGALALTGAVIGIVGGYLATMAVARGDQQIGLSALRSVPVTNLLVILIGMPLAAVIIGWLVAGREPAAVARQPLE